ncbi:MAG TPA: LacI family DNA-binding transcriptional regulator [Rudaea sp.]|nr:LacI family DNA-binding transcriptional regulator [Rudaea sp.]
MTLNDIAREAQVSRATVSLVLRESPLVRGDTRARVLGEMRRLGYVYNRAAANLRRQHSSNIALVINDLSNPFFAEFAAGVDEALGGSGYVTLLGSTGESAARQQAVLGSLMQHDLAAVILSPAEGSDAEQIQAAVGTHTPLLVFNRELSGADRVRVSWDFLGLDNRRGAYLAAQHLLDLGHRRIAFFGGHADSSSCRERRAGYLDALNAHGITPEPRWMVECAPTRLQSAAQTGALFVRDPAPTAAVAYNDAVALGLMLGLAQRGLRAGHDFSVTGFDDIPEASVSTPPLTTVAVGPRERGRQAAQLALWRAQGARDAHVRSIASVQLNVRASTVPPPPGTP